MVDKALSYDDRIQLCRLDIRRAQFLYTQVESVEDKRKVLGLIEMYTAALVEYQRAKRLEYAYETLDNSFREYKQRLEGS